MQNITLSREKILRRMQRYGFNSLGELAQHIGVHRNTLGHFLSGRNVVPNSICKLFEILDLDPSEVFIKGESAKDSQPSWLQISEVIDAIYSDSPRCNFIMFGSRIRGDSRAYSDFDLGVFSETPLSTKDYLELVEKVEVLSEDLPFRIELVNLNNAEPQFIRTILPHHLFIAGNRSVWEKFIERILRNGNPTN